MSLSYVPIQPCVMSHVIVACDEPALVKPKSIVAGGFNLTGIIIDRHFLVASSFWKGWATIIVLFVCCFLLFGLYPER